MSKGTELKWPNSENLWFKLGVLCPITESRLPRQKITVIHFSLNDDHPDFFLKKGTIFNVGNCSFQPLPYSYGYQVSDPSGDGGDYGHRQRTDAAGVTSGE